MNYKCNIILVTYHVHDLNVIKSVAIMEELITKELEIEIYTD
ncbi:CC chemokine-like protein [Magpiepox virus 2]|nr:CC chemokine-like protein [Magpiepox virus 2]